MAPAHTGDSGHNYNHKRGHTMNRKRLETYEWINTAACLDTLEARTDLTEDEVQWLLNRIDFLGTPAEVSIARMKGLYSGTQA